MKETLSADRRGPATVRQHDTRESDPNGWVCRGLRRLMRPMR